MPVLEQAFSLAPGELLRCGRDERAGWVLSRRAKHRSRTSRPLITIVVQNWILELRDIAAGCGREVSEVEIQVRDRGSTARRSMKLRSGEFVEQGQHWNLRAALSRELVAKLTPSGTSPSHLRRLGVLVAVGRGDACAIDNSH